MPRKLSTTHAIQKRVRIKTPLSIKPHVAIRQAVADVLALLKLDSIVITQETIDDAYVRPDNDSGRCSVCVAGASMMRRCGLPETPQDTKYYTHDASDGEYIHDRLRGINEFRRGDVKDGLFYFRLVPKTLRQLRRFSVPEFNPEKPAPWIKHMLKMADYVESIVPDMRPKSIHDW